MPRRLLMGAPLQVAENNGSPEALGEPIDFLVENSLQLVTGLGPALLPRHRRKMLVPAPPGGGRPGARRGAKRHLIEPRTQRITHPETPGLLDQDEKGGLKGILAVARIGQHTTANAQNHRTVPFDQNREGQLGGLAPAGGEPLQKLTIGQLPRRSHVEKGAKLLGEQSILAYRHQHDSPRACSLREIIGNVTAGGSGSNIPKSNC